MTARKDPQVYLDDMCHAIERIEGYTAAGEQAFLASTLTQDMDFHIMQAPHCRTCYLRRFAIAPNPLLCYDD